MPSSPMTNKPIGPYRLRVVAFRYVDLNHQPVGRPRYGSAFTEASAATRAPV